MARIARGVVPFAVFMTGIVLAGVGVMMVNGVLDYSEAVDRRRRERAQKGAVQA
jgi:hypothetical protein